MALQDKVSQAWLNFAKTGNPSQPGLEFKPYTAADAATRWCSTPSASATRSRDDKLVSLLPAPAPRK